MAHSGYDWTKWALADRIDSEAIREMVLVQQLLHGLAGGDASALQAAAKATVSRLAADVSTTPAGTPGGIVRPGIRNARLRRLIRAVMNWRVPDEGSPILAKDVVAHEAPPTYTVRTSSAPKRT